MWCFYQVHKVVIEMYGLDNNLDGKPQPRCDADASAIRIALSPSHSRVNKNVRPYEYSIEVIPF